LAKALAKRWGQKNEEGQLADPIFLSPFFCPHFSVSARVVFLLPFFRVSTIFLFFYA